MKKKILLLAGAVLLLIACCTFAGCVGDQSASSTNSIVGSYSMLLTDDNSEGVELCVLDFESDGTGHMFKVNADLSMDELASFKWEKTGDNTYKSGGLLLKKVDPATNNGKSLMLSLDDGNAWHYLTQRTCDDAPILGAWQMIEDGTPSNIYLEFKSDGTYIVSIDFRHIDRGVSKTTFNWKRFGGNYYVQYIGDNYDYGKFYTSTDGKLIKSPGDGNHYTYIRIEESEVPN